MLIQTIVCSVSKIQSVCIFYTFIFEFPHSYLISLFTDYVWLNGCDWQLILCKYLLALPFDIISIVSDFSKRKKESRYINRAPACVIRIHTHSWPSECSYKPNWIVSLKICTNGNGKIMLLLFWVTHLFYVIKKHIWRRCQMYKWAK